MRKTNPNMLRRKLSAVIDTNRTVKVTLVELTLQMKNPGRGRRGYEYVQTRLNFRPYQLQPRVVRFDFRNAAFEVVSVREQ